MLESTLLECITASRRGSDDRKLFCAPANNAGDEGKEGAAESNILPQFQVSPMGSGISSSIQASKFRPNKFLCRLSTQPSFHIKTSHLLSLLCIVLQDA